MKLAALLTLLLLAACTREQPPAKAEKTAQPVVQGDSDKEVDAKAKSIEQAADAAAKLIEEEANQEIARMRGDEAK